MSEIKKSDPCPCGSENTFEKCCHTYLSGKKSPETAETLMRSRYSAFVTKNIPYLIDTHHPETRKTLDQEAITDWAENSIWQGLEIIDSEAGTEKDDQGVIEFRAKYIQGGKSYNHHERSEFKKDNKQWYFFDVTKNMPIKNDAKVGRNDPCPCGSGSKYKKCHGKAA